MAQGNFSRIAGVEAHTLTEAKVKINARTYYGFDKLTWGSTIEGAEMIYGTEFEPIAETRGTYKGNCEFDLLLSEYIILVGSLGGDYLTQRWDLQANIKAEGGALHTLVVPRCRIVDDSVTLERGKATYKSIKCSVLGRITINGKPSASGFASSANTIGASVSAAISF